MWPGERTRSSMPLFSIWRPDALCLHTSWSLPLMFFCCRLTRLRSGFNHIYIVLKISKGLSWKRQYFSHHYQRVDYRPLRQRRRTILSISQVLSHCVLSQIFIPPAARETLHSLSTFHSRSANIFHEYLYIHILIDG